MIGGGNRDDVRQVVAGGVVGFLVRVDFIIARGGHKQDPFLPAGLDGVVQCLARRPAAPTGIGDANIDPVG